MPLQISGAKAVLVSETNATSYFAGGTFQLGNGPFTDLAFSASDDETDFAAFGAQYTESSGSGRQLGELTDDGGSTFDIGLASLEAVLHLSDPGTGATISVGRVTIRDDNGQPGGGSTLQDFYIFSAPIDPTVTYNVSSIDYTPGSAPENSYEYSEFAGGNVVCFSNGTEILTDKGPVAVEHIKIGMRVQTFDNGPKEVVWTGFQDVSSGATAKNENLLPVRIAPGALGNEKQLFVSQQHRILVGDMFVKAKHLVSVPGFPARLARGRRNLKYVHLLLEDHNVLFANGLGAESLYLGPVANSILENRRIGPSPTFGIEHMKADLGGLARSMAKKHLVNEHVKKFCAKPSHVAAEKKCHASAK